MLRRERVRQLERVARIGYLHQRERGVGDRRTLGGELRQQRVERLDHARARRHRHDDAAFSVLCLREHVQRRECHLVLGSVRGECEQQVARAGEPVDPDDAREQPLGLLHIEVSRTDDDVDARDRLGAAGQRGDRLGAAHPVNPLDAAQPARAEYRHVDLAAGARRRAHGDVEHARGARGDDAHHDGARIRRPPAGHVDRSRAHWHLAQRDALALGKVDGDVLADARLGDLGDVGDRHL